MGEINTGEETTENVDQAEAEGSADQEETQTGAESDTDTQGDTESEEKGEEDEEKTESDPDVDEEPKLRKRNIDFILERKNRKIEKLKNKEDEAQDDDESDDEDIDPDDAKIIKKQVEKVLSPFIAKQMEEEDTQEITTFVKDNPDFAPYVDKVKKFAQHPSRKDIPIQSIFYEVAGPDLLKIGAERAQKANDEAKESGAGGGSSQGDSSDKSVWDLTPEEFTAQQEELRNKSRD